MMRCADCHYFLPDHGSAGLCVAAETDRICAPGGCTGLPFRRVFAQDEACRTFRKRA